MSSARKVDEPWIRDRLGTASPFCEGVVKWPMVIVFMWPTNVKSALTGDVCIGRFDDMSSASDWTPGAQVRSWHKTILKSFCRNQFLHKFVNLSFTITNMKNKLTDLWGSEKGLDWANGVGAKFWANWELACCQKHAFFNQVACSIFLLRGSGQQTLFSLRENYPFWRWTCHTSLRSASEFSPKMGRKFVIVSVGFRRNPPMSLRFCLS